MEFIFNATGSKLNTDNPFVIEQMEKNPSAYTKVVDKPEPKKAEKKPAKAEKE